MSYEITSLNKAGGECSARSIINQRPGRFCGPLTKSS